MRRTSDNVSDRVVVTKLVVQLQVATSTAIWRKRAVPYVPAKAKSKAPPASVFSRKSLRQNSNAAPIAFEPRKPIG